MRPTTTPKTVPVGSRTPLVIHAPDLYHAPEGCEMTDGRGAPLSWGAERELNALETVMWRAEVDPYQRSPMVLVELLDRVPDRDRFFAAADWASRMAPRFRQKLLEPALGIGQPIWVTDPEFDMGYHLRHVAVPEGTGMAGFLRMVEQAAMTPLDRARPPWEAVLFEGLPGGRAAFLLKIHHVASDGMAGIQLLTQLHSRTRDATPEKPQPAPPPPERPRKRDVLRQQLLRDASALRGAVRGGTALARTLSSREGLRESADYAASFGRMLRDPDAGNSPLLAGRSLSVRFVAFDVPFASLRAAGKSVGGSINDAYLAALLGAFRRYHEAKGQPVDAIPVAMPISVRRPGEVGGNRFVGVRFAGPLAIADPAQRIQAVRAIVQGLRAEKAMDAASVIAPVVARLPAAFLTAVTGQLTKKNDLQATNVPGLREPAYFAGARIERSYGFAPRPGCAAMVSLLTHLDQCCIAANLDPAAISDIEGFQACLVDGFGEVLSLLDDPPEPQWLQ